MIKSYLGAALIAAATTTAGHAATFQFFDTQESFDSVFDTNAVAFDLNALDSGLTITGDDVSIEAGVLTDSIDQDNAVDTVFSFATPQFGFGGIFDLSLAGPGSGIEIAVTIGGETFVLGQELPSTFTEGFFGFASDTSFTEILFSEGSRSSRPSESYTFTGAVASAVAPVPLPAGLPLMLAGLGSFAFLRKRRRQAVA